ncbi:MAG: efflux RND transporter periplasmic adaptor subunit [Armatimonadetes bacterium]|nr:efflux RND transporter periplasmic adaptor subunit [Armatimonadota bacterium]
MQKLLTIIKKQGVALLILAASFVGVMWIVQNKRPPGSMTVVEAQAMDMKAMRAPIGVIPVGADYVLERNVGGSEKFPATVAALSDEDIVARVPGLVKQIHVYPGDRVRAGQLLATLEADEFNARALAGTLAAQASQNRADAASHALEQQTAALLRADFEASAAESGVDVAKAGLKAAESHIGHYQGEVQEILAKKKEAVAELDYAKADYKREQQLYNGGAVSRDELDIAKKNVETAQAKIEQVDAQLMQIGHELEVRNANLDAAGGALRQAQARLDGALAGASQAKQGVGKAEADVAAMERQADSARATSQASGVLASYTELRASDDGVVTDRLVSPGTPVMPGQAVLRVKVDRQLRVQADLPQRLASSVKVGSAVRITSGGEMKDAKITSVFPFVEGRTRTFRVEAIVPNSDFRWRVGSYAEMEVSTSAPVRTLSVRNASVKTAFDGSHYVWVAFGEDMEIADDALYTCTMHPDVEHVGPGDCPICNMPLVPVDATGNVRAEKRTVEIGPSDARYTTILDGLAEGDSVTWAGDSGLFPGAAVQAVEWDENGPVKLPSGAGVMLHDGEEMSFDEHEDMDMGDDGDMEMGDDEVGDASTMAGHEGHAHGPDDNFTCPMHPDVHKSEEGICPICKMNLVPIEDGGK